MVCNKCGKESGNAAFCEGCGAPHAKVPAVQKKKQKLLKALIAAAAILLAGTAAVYFAIPGMLKPYNLGVKVQKTKL